MSKSGDIKGLDKLIKDLISLGKDGEEVVAEVTKRNAEDIAFNAKLLAPLDTGKLKQSIKDIKLDKLTYKISANATGLAPYAAYMEFGTGGLVKVPEELKDVAIQFIGKGIKQINLKPRPYLYPSYVKGKAKYFDDLKDELKNLTKKI